jgi:hypothetical protein
MQWGNEKQLEEGHGELLIMSLPGVQVPEKPLSRPGQGRLCDASSYSLHPRTIDQQEPISRF